MRLWPWHLDDSIFSIVLAISALLITLSLAILRIVSISSGRICRDLVYLGLHLMSALSVIGYVLLHAEYNADDLELCQMSNCFQYTGEYLRRMFALWIFWLRLNAFIGPVYPKWLWYPTLIPIVGWIINLSLVLSIEFGGDEGSFVSDDGICLDRRHISDEYVFNSCVVAALFEVLPSIVFLVLFIIPLLKYRDDVLGKTIRKHVLIATVDLVVELLFITLVIANDMSNASFWEANIILYIGLIVNNVILIFIFADWRKYFCINNMPQFIQLIKIRDPKESLRQLSIRSNSLQQPLLKETELLQK